MVSKRLIVISIVLVLVSSGGIIAFGVLTSPEIAELDSTFGFVNDSETQVETRMVVYNPNPFGINLERLDVEYTIHMNDAEMASEEIAGVVVGPGSTTVTLSSVIDHEKIPGWWVAHVANGERTTVDVAAKIESDRLDVHLTHTHTTSMETDMLAELRSDEVGAVNADQATVDDPIFYINETDAAWGVVTETEIPIETDLRVYNPNDEPYAITGLGYEVTMNDIQVGSGETDTEYVIPAHGHEDVAMTSTIDATSLDVWWERHLDETVHGHQVSVMRIEFWAIVEIPTGEQIEVDLEELTYHEYIETDVFDEGGPVGAPSEDAQADD